MDFSAYGYQTTGGEQAVRDENGRFAKGNNIGIDNQFKQGKSGNPNGRKNAISDIFNELLDIKCDDKTTREELAERMIAIAKKGNNKDFFTAFDRIIDRTEGKALDRIEQTIKQEPIRILEID